MHASTCAAAGSNAHCLPSLRRTRRATRSHQAIARHAARRVPRILMHRNEAAPWLPVVPN
ncbi:hypothetical protein CFB39_22925 [Burkholderia sp. AU6039]|nr:hypothetical protein CFB39_22925 [Burkholderia sp. AU6039]